MSRNNPLTHYKTLQVTLKNVIMGSEEEQTNFKVCNNVQFLELEEMAISQPKQYVRCKNCK